MKSLKELQEMKIKAQENLNDINKIIDERKSQTVLLCENNNYGKGCGYGFKIKDLTYIQTYWYKEPHGCNGGAYWVPGEGQWKCPNCGKKNRLYDKPDIVEISHLFKNTVEEKE